MRSRSSAWTLVTALGVAAFQVVGSFGASENQPERQAIDALAIVLLLAGPAALARRDRWPLVAVVVSIAADVAWVALGYAYGPITASVLVALYSAVQAGYRKETWWLAGIGYGAMVAASLVDPERDTGNLAVHLALVGGWMVVALAVSEVVRVRREQAAERVRAEEEERQRRAGERRLQLAQELHDVLAHNISLINVQASVALHLLDEQPDQARPALTTIKEASRDSLQELRTALDLLRRDEMAPLSPAPGLADLDDLVDGVRSTGLDVTVERDGDVPPLPHAVELAAYRIVQEALTNVTRHAAARHATVRVGFDDGVRIEVTDDGCGAAAPVPGRGITGMKERAGAFGGTLQADPQPDGGFRVAAHLPVPQP